MCVLSKNRIVQCGGSLLLCLFILILSEPVAAQLTPKTLLAPTVATYGPQYQDVEDAFQAYNRRDFKQARRSLATAYQKNPELAPPDVMLAMIHLSVGRGRDAEAAIDRAIVEQPQDPEAYILLGDLALREGRKTIADLAYHRGLELVKNSESNAHRFRNLQIRLQAGSASLAEVREQYEKAAGHLNAWLALDPENPMPHGSLGRIQFRLKDFAAARASFTKLKALDEDAPPVEIAMGRLYSDAGMQALAKEQMDAAIKNAGNDVRARLTIAEWALDQGLPEMAQQSIDAVLKLDPNSVGGQVLLARLARTRNKTDEAAQILTAAVLASPNSFAVTNELARTLAVSPDEKKRAAGLDYARRNFQSYQKRNAIVGREAAMTYAWLLLHNGRTSEAEAAISTLTTGSTLSKENAYFVGKIYADGGKPHVAITALQAALSQETPFPGRDAAEKLLAELSKAE